MNTSLFYAINGYHTPLLDQCMIFAGNLASFSNLPWVVGALLLLCLVPPRARSTAPFSLLAPRTELVHLLIVLINAAVVAIALVIALKHGLAMPRPAVALPEGTVQLLMEPDSKYSFPSGHATFAMLMAAVFWPWCGWLLRTFLVVFVLWMGFARISLGLHFPIDILAGYVCAAGSALASHLEVRFFRRKYFPQTLPAEPEA